VSARRPHGFTLLEVLVALAVVSLALVALVRAAGLSADALARERETTMATWVASNVIADVRLGERFPEIGRSEGVMPMGTGDWYWRLDVQGSDDPAIRRLEVAVFEDAARARPVTSLTGFAGPP
jgi:general secretion pathway protein I